jgi:cytoskeleton protein RodZ
MDGSIGNVFREARNRRKIDLSEVEAATRIRVRYLRAIENEEWEALPGGVYTRGFIRTYGGYLGLDGDRLADDYRKSVEGGRRPGPDPVAGSASAPPPSWDLRALRAPLTVGIVLLIAVLAIVLIPGGGSGGGGVSPRAKDNAVDHPRGHVQVKAPSPGVSVRLAASAEVWVCMLNAKGVPLVDGQILETGAEEGPFRSGSFTVSFGNGEVSMLVDGKEAQIPATSSPIGYSIDSSGGLRRLDEAERPSCA